MRRREGRKTVEGSTVLVGKDEWRLSDIRLKVREVIGGMLGLNL